MAGLTIRQVCSDNETFTTLLLINFTQLVGTYQPVRANGLGPYNQSDTQDGGTYILRVCYYGAKQHCSCVADGGECEATSDPCLDRGSGCDFQWDTTKAMDGVAEVKAHGIDSKNQAVLIISVGIPVDHWLEIDIPVGVR